ncbi:MAG: hypothetical protein JWR34_262 [Mycobacterium sp.]|nr:hypothetical protein [Mycobacterium sp.]
MRNETLRPTLPTKREWAQLFAHAHAHGKAPSVPLTVLIFKVWPKPISERPQYNFRTQQHRSANVPFSARQPGRRGVKLPDGWQHRDAGHRDEHRQHCCDERATLPSGELERSVGERKADTKEAFVQLPGDDFEGAKPLDVHGIFIC